MNSLFGVDLPTPVNFVIAFVVVLLLIGAATWLVRRFGATRLDAAARSRQPRLAVVDAAAVDGRRKLVIVRRDNVEHLLMIGGPTDVVVETNIVRAAIGGRDTAAGAQRPHPTRAGDLATGTRARCRRSPRARARAAHGCRGQLAADIRRGFTTARADAAGARRAPRRHAREPRRMSSAVPRPSRTRAAPGRGRNAGTPACSRASRTRRAAGRRPRSKPRRNGAAARSRAAPAEAGGGRRSRRRTAGRSQSARTPAARASSQHRRAARSPPHSRRTISSRKWQAF